MSTYKRGEKSRRMPPTAWFPITRKSITVTVQETPDAKPVKRKVKGDFRIFKSGAIYEVMPHPKNNWVRIA
jgi:hypothetical protein